jgi:hypothetical protein
MSADAVETGDVVVLKPNPILAPSSLHMNPSATSAYFSKIPMFLSAYFLCYCSIFMPIFSKSIKARHPSHAWMLRLKRSIHLFEFNRSQDISLDSGLAKFRGWL